MKPHVVIVIVVWNGIEDTLECLKSLGEDRYPRKDILVVDNGSTDESADRIHEEGHPVSIISSPVNLGFTGGNNLGLAEAERRGAKYAFLLNNDTILEPDALSLLVEAAEASADAALISPAVHYYDSPGEVWFCGASLCLARGEALHESHAKDGDGAFLKKDGVGTSGFYPSAWVSGCAMLVRMTAVKQVGGFDDRFFLTWEDVDWCVRMRRYCWEVGVVPAARIYHKCGRSGARLTGIHRYYAVRNSLLLAAKHAGSYYGSAIFYVLGRHLRSALRSDRAGRWQSLATIFEGLKDHLLGRYGRRPSLGKGVAA